MGETGDTRVAAVMRVDATGLVCPMPTIRLGQSIRKIGLDEVVEVWTDDPGSKQNMNAWCRNTGHELCDETTEGSVFKYWVRRKR
jgi:TusA-related sulfurtransferase